MTPAPPPAYHVERVRPEDVADDLRSLWDRNLTVEGGVRAKFDWLYRAAPLGSDDVFLLVAADGTRVGTAGVGVRAMQLGERTGTAGLLGDLAVDKAHRSVGPALALTRAVKEWALANHDIAYGFPNKLAAGVFKRVGYQTLGMIQRWALVLRHASYAARVRELELDRIPPAARDLLYRAIDLPGVVALAGFAVDVGHFARRMPATLAAARQFKLTCSPEPDPAVDELWARARHEYDICSHRTHAVLAWRYPARPERSWWHVYARATGELRAYAVIDRAGNHAYVKDLFGHKPDILALLDLLPAAKYRRGAHSLSIRYLGAPWLSDALAAHGFQPRQADRMIAVATGKALSADLCAHVSNVEAWHLTDYDEDT